MDQKRGLILVLATAIISGFAIFINKFSVARLDSSVFTFLKNIIVAIFLLSIILFTREIKSLKKITKKQLFQLVLIGLIGGSIPFLLFFKGLSLTTAASSAFVHKTLFIYATVFALIFLKEKLNKSMLTAASLLLTGNLLLLELNSFSFGFGELLVLIATIFWALENVLSKYTLKELSGNLVAFGRMFFGSLFTLIFLFYINKASMISSISYNDLLWILITSLILLLFVVTYYNGLKYIKVSTATSILLLGSPITTLLSFVFIDHVISVLQLGGILLISLGVLMTVYFVEFSKIGVSQQHIRNEY